MATAPHTVFIKGVGAFSVLKESQRVIAFDEQTVPANQGEFAVERSIPLSDPSAGITASNRHAGGPVGAGVADATNADTSRPDIIGAGPQLTTVAITASGADGTATASPGTTADDATYGANAWTNIANIAASDDARATNASAGLTHYAKATNFGFAASGTIKGVQVLVEKSKAVAAANTGAVSPGTLANFASIGTNAWTNPSNAGANDAVYATDAIAGTTQGLRASNLGLAISLTATILGIQVEIERKGTTGSTSANSGATFPGTGATGSGGSGWAASWTNPGNIVSANAVYATIANSGSGTFSDTPYLVASNFGFSIPAGATIVGLTFTVEAKSNDAGGTLATEAGQTAGVTKNASSLAGAMTTTPQGMDTSLRSYFYGSTVSIPVALTPTEVNASGFGFLFSAHGKNSVIVSVDDISCTVYYTVPNNVTDSTVQLIDNTSAVTGSNKSVGAIWAAAEQYDSFGGAADVWGATLTPAIVNSSNFGAVVSASVGTGCTASVDHIRITVFYQDSGVVDSAVRLVVNGIVQGQNKADTSTQWGTSDAVSVYGGPADMWGLTTAQLTAALVNASSFGAVFSANVTSGTSQIDQIRITIYYASASASIPTKIWDDGLDSLSAPHRYIYVAGGSRIHVIDPTTDTEVESVGFAATVDGWDAARWSGQWMACPRGISTDLAQIITAFDGSHSRFLATDYSATALTAGPDALYRAYVSGVNKALTQKTTNVTAPVASTGTLTLTGQPLNTETVTIDAKVYTFQNVLTNVDGNVKIGATAALSLTNLINAITLWGGVAGTDYALAMTVHPTAYAVQGTGLTMTLTARQVTSNAKATTETLTNGSFGAVTLGGGSDGYGAVTNWSPSGGEQLGDAGVGVHRLAAFGGRFVGGKDDGLAEFGQDFQTGFYLEWMRQFQWSLQCNGILALGLSGDMIVTFRRGLYMLPRNISIGVEQLPNNESDKRGAYTDVTWDGNWIYAALWNPNSLAAHLIKMKLRPTAQANVAPGIMAHHPIVTRAASQFQALFLWPGATVNGTAYGPRLYFALDASTIGYIRLGVTQPDQADANARFNTGDWTVDWPLDDLGDPRTMKFPYRLVGTFENVDGTGGAVWRVRPSATDDWTDLTADGYATGEAVVVQDGHHRRYGPRDTAIGNDVAPYIAKRWQVRLFGTGGSATAQMRVLGRPVLTVLEQPEMVRQIVVPLSLQSHVDNDDDAMAQWNKLNLAAGGSLIEVETIHASEDGNDISRRFMAYADAERVSDVVSSGQSGVIIAKLTLRAMDFHDEGDEADVG